MADITELLNSMPPELIKALSNASDDDIKNALSNLWNNNETYQTLSKTKTIDPRHYHITIKPDEWEKNGDNWFNSREVYENDSQLREASIVSISIDEEKMLKENDNYLEVNKFIDEIYDNALIHLNAKNFIGEFTYLGKDRPKYVICLIIEELPFLDTPASEFGL